MAMTAVFMNCLVYWACCAALIPATAANATNNYLFSNAIVYHGHMAKSAERRKGCGYRGTAVAFVHFQQQNNSHDRIRSSVKPSNSIHYSAETSKGIDEQQKHEQWCYNKHTVLIDTSLSNSCQDDNIGSIDPIGSSLSPLKHLKSSVSLAKESLNEAKCKKKSHIQIMAIFLHRVTARIQQIKTTLRNFQLMIHNIIPRARILSMLQYVPTHGNALTSLLSPFLLSFALFFSNPATSHASSKYSNSDPYMSTIHTPPKRKTISIQARPSQPYSTTRTSSYPTSTRTKRRGTIASKRMHQKSQRQIENAKRLSFLIVGATFAGTSYRAKRIGGGGGNKSNVRRGRRIRNTSPFGIIRNLSLLGNGVSVIRVRIAFEFKKSTMIDARRLLGELDKEAHFLQNTIGVRERVMGNNLSNGKCMRVDTGFVYFRDTMIDPMKEAGAIKMILTLSYFVSNTLFAS